ncbi:Major facilitator superfamily domain, general substrate transporter [Artemisia annua]|uniref:Major facilitator superfamily domain, general substrate transporter n=1 Tax=Artemisia annua TaxID=35608 RepID=A0A2U1NIA7_ARTAN|nr:Major facilitator superfamily domain, general substrate transporter [Artemisia annua]
MVYLGFTANLATSTSRLSYSAAASMWFFKCREFAKALHYKEMEFEGALSKKMDVNPVAVVEALIHTNSRSRDIDIRSTAFGCGTEGIMVWQAILAVMSLVLPPTEDSETWLKFASLCWKRGRVDQVKSTLIKLLQVCKIFFSHPSISLASVCLSLASSIFLFGFETWMVVEHDKLGHRLDSLNEMFWLMTFLESASLIGSQVLANWLISSNDIHKNMVSPSTATAILALLCIIYCTRMKRISTMFSFFKGNGEQGAAVLSMMFVTGYNYLQKLLLLRD